jgi:hypothetical protein
MGHPWTKKQRGGAGYAQEYGRWQAGLRQHGPVGHHYGIDGMTAMSICEAMDEIILACGGKLKHGTHASRRAEWRPADVARWQAAYTRRGLAA